MRRRIPSILVVFALSLSAALVAGGGVGLPSTVAGAAVRAAEPAAPGDVGPGTPTYAVGRRTISVTSEPGRTVPVDVWYPADRAAVTGLAKTVYAIPGASYTSSVAYEAPPVAPGGPFPLIVYSHGSGGQRFVSAFLTEALAARGYVVVAADHLGNTALDQFTNTTAPVSEIARLRPVDIRGEIAALTTATADPASPFSGAVDPKRIGLVGHSAGGAGVLLTAAGHDGAAVPAGLRAVVGMGTYVEPVTNAELAAVKTPTLLVSGTLDDTTPITTETVRAWKGLGGPVIRLDVAGAGHQSYTDVCFYSQLVDARPEIPDAIRQAIKSRDDAACTPRFLAIDQAHRIVDRWVIGFLDRYVKGQRSAEKLLVADDPKVEHVRTRGAKARG